MSTLPSPMISFPMRAFDDLTLLLRRHIRPALVEGEAIHAVHPRSKGCSLSRSPPRLPVSAIRLPTAFCAPRQARTGRGSLRPKSACPSKRQSSRRTCSFQRETLSAQTNTSFFLKFRTKNQGRSLCGSMPRQMRMCRFIILFARAWRKLAAKNLSSQEFCQPPDFPSRSPLSRGNTVVPASRN